VIEGKRVLAVIPARGGSKGVPLKNIRSILGVPLITWAAKTIEEAGFIDCSVVSTDHEDIKKVAVDSGLEVPFFRPPEISGDRISDHPVLVHALQEMEKRDDVVYDIILMLQPTSPLRKAHHLQHSVEMLIEGQFDSVWTVSETDSKSHPLKQLEVSDQGVMDYYDPKGGEIIARQQLSTLYHRNGACYAFTRDCLLNQGKIEGAKAGSLITEAMISIDTLSDFRMTELLMTETKIELSEFPLPGEML
jgi:CMP-N,N'-diacetyllegionaminic acid synthase